VTAISIDKDWEPTHLPAAYSLGRLANLLKDLATKIEVHEDRTSYWQAIFLQSKANGCSYRGEDLPHSNWQWPKDTWFQEHVRHHLRGVAFTSQQARN